MNTFQHLRVEDQGTQYSILWIDMVGRRLNVLDEGFFDELTAMAGHLTAKGVDRPLFVRSAKEKGYIVGADLRRIMQIESDADIQAFLKRGQDALNLWENLPFPTIAWIDGACLGGGLEFAMACTYRIASNATETVLGMPETKLGLTPGWGGTHRLISLVGLRRGLQMLCFGEPIRASEALEYGLIDGLWDLRNAEIELAAWNQRLVEAAERRPLCQRLDARSEWAKERSLMEEQIQGGGEANSALVKPARLAILKAVERGIFGSPDEGLYQERSNFYKLLKRPEVEVALQRFVKPKSA